MHMRTRALRAEQLRRMRARFSVWAPTFVMHTREAARQEAHESCAAADRQARGTRVSSRTHMHMRVPDVYRETRRNAPRRPGAGARHTRPLTARRRLSTLVEAEIGSSLYDNMCLIASRFLRWLTRDDG